MFRLLLLGRTSLPNLLVPLLICLKVTGILIPRRPGGHTIRISSIILEAVQELPALSIQWLDRRSSETTRVLFWMIYHALNTVDLAGLNITSDDTPENTWVVELFANSVLPIVGTNFKLASLDLLERCRSLFQVHARVDWHLVETDFLFVMPAFPLLESLSFQVYIFISMRIVFRVTRNLCWIENNFLRLLFYDLDGDDASGRIVLLLMVSLG